MFKLTVMENEIKALLTSGVLLLVSGIIIAFVVLYKNRRKTGKETQE